MQSNNPVFRRAEGFNGPANQYGNPAYPGNGAAYQGYAQPGYPPPVYGTDPSTWGTGAPSYPPQTRPMTIDSVVQKTGAALGIVVLTAALTWILSGPIVDEAGLVVNPDNLQLVYLLSAVGAGGAFILSLVNSFKRVISPALVMAFCAFEGVALGALSKMFDAYFPPGVVTGAVIGTFAAFAGTLAAYKFFNIRVTGKFKMFVMAAVFGMVGLSILELVLSMFGAGLGLFGFGTLGLITAIVGLVLGIFMLVLDFDFVEHGIAAGLPEVESWRAAFAMTVSLVWIYTNLLRLLAIFSQD